MMFNCRIIWVLYMLDYVGMVDMILLAAPKIVDRRSVPFSDFVPPNVPTMMPIRQGCANHFEDQKFEP